MERVSTKDSSNSWSRVLCVLVGRIVYEALARIFTVVAGRSMIKECKNINKTIDIKSKN